MAGKYRLDSRATTNPFAPTEVGLTAATRKTVLQVGVPSTTGLYVLGWGVSFDGVTAGNDPVICDLIDTDVAATAGTSQTPDKWEDDNNEASLCVGGTGASGYNFGTEGTITGARALDTQNVHPQSGYSIWFPDLHTPRVKVSRFLRLRCLAAQTVNALPWIVWRE